MKQFFVSIACVIMLLSVIGCEIVPQQPVTFKMEGVVSDVNFIAQGSFFKALAIKETVVSFNDGRIRVFRGISRYTFQKGKVNVITFDKHDYIIAVEIR